MPCYSVSLILYLHGSNDVAKLLCLRRMLLDHVLALLRKFLLPKHVRSIRKTQLPTAGRKQESTRLRGFEADDARATSNMYVEERKLKCNSVENAFRVSPRPGTLLETSS